MSTLLQIVPKIPGDLDGVGDYALTVAGKLREDLGCETVFAAFKIDSRESPGGFRSVALDHLADDPTEYDHLLLHYVNYGFQKRGVPLRLLSVLRGLRARHRGRFITVFHELYASGPPWRSAFWLQPFQIDLAKSIAQLTDLCIVSSDNFRGELRRMAPHAELELHPVPSGLGEPTLSIEQIANRDPHCWAIFGGTRLVERSMHSFCQVRPRIPGSIAPRSLYVLGGADNPATRSRLRDLGIESIYRPSIAAGEASKILRTCSFAWFNYFHRPGIETSMILKSSAFASACAHAVIPVFPHPGTPISIDGDHLPGPFFLDFDRAEIPGAETRSETAAEIYTWYKRYASSEHLIQGIASALGLRG